jgi:hypothetical protein
MFDFYKFLKEKITRTNILRNFLTKKRDWVMISCKLFFAIGLKSQKSIQLITLK